LWLKEWRGRTNFDFNNLTILPKRKLEGVTAPGAMLVTIRFQNRPLNVCSLLHGSCLYPTNLARILIRWNNYINTTEGHFSLLFLNHHFPMSIRTAHSIFFHMYHFLDPIVLEVNYKKGVRWRSINAILQGKYSFNLRSLLGFLWVTFP